MLISTPCQSTCSPWATADDACAPCDDDYAIDTMVLANSLQVASDVLFELSGRRWAGICEDTVRPCLRSLSRDYGRPIRPPYPFGGPYGFWAPAAYSGYQSPTSGFWMTQATDRSGGQIVSEITLGAFPIDGIVEVKIDGVVLDPSRYRIDDNRWLVRLPDADGNNPGWPGSQRMDLDADQPGTWQVAYLYGMPPPPAGKLAASVLGCQLALACSPSAAGNCRLPSRITSLTRQGVSMVVIDPYTFLDKGRTGLYECDIFLSTYNPTGQRRRGTVSSPDIRRRVRRAGTG